MSADQDMKKSYWYPSFLLFQAQLIICDQHVANVLSRGRYIMSSIPVKVKSKMVKFPFGVSLLSIGKF